MKKQSIILCFVIIAVLLSCSNLKQQKTVPIHDPEVSITNVKIDHLLDSFAEINLDYSRCSKNVGFVRILNSDDNNTFKLFVTSFRISDTILKRLYCDGVIKKNGFTFFVDYNQSNLFSNSNRKIIYNLMENTDSITKPKCNANFTWLIQVKNDSIDKINYRANSIFGPKCGNCLEWGGFLDEEGNFHER